MKKILKTATKLSKITMDEIKIQELKKKLKKQKDKFKKEQEQVRKEVNEKMITLITAAFSLVAALAWNDTIKSIFQKVFGTAQTVWAMIIYAILVTIIAVWVTYWITKNKTKKK